MAIHESTTGWGSYNPFEDPFLPGTGMIIDPISSSHRNSDTPDPYDLTGVALRDTMQIPAARVRRSSFSGGQSGRVVAPLPYSLASGGRHGHVGGCHDSWAIRRV